MSKKKQITQPLVLVEPDMLRLNNLVTKHNDLIEAEYELTRQEQHLILFLVSLIQPTDTDFHLYRVPAQMFAELFNCKHSEVYNALKNIADSLRTKGLVIKKANSEIHLSWISSIEYFFGEGYIEVAFDPKLKPYLIQLQKNFVSYQLEEVVNLKSKYSIRMFELLVKDARFKQRTFTIPELRSKLGIKEHEYQKYSAFKKYVLLQSQSEIREKTSMVFDFEEIKSGKRIAKLRFSINIRSLVDKNIKKLASPTEMNLIEIFNEEGIPLDTNRANKLSNWAEKLSDEEIRIVAQALNYAYLSGKIANPVAYLLSNPESISKAILKGKFPGLKKQGKLFESDENNDDPLFDPKHESFFLNGIKRRA